MAAAPKGWAQRVTAGQKPKTKKAATKAAPKKKG